jgi:hypothetical protein
MSLNSGDPEGVAHRFVAALDDERWDEVAEHVASETLFDFYSWWIEQLRRWGDEPDPGKGDTEFAPVATMLGVSCVAEAERLSPAQLLARYARGLQVEAALARIAGEEPPSRTYLPKLVRKIEEISPSSHGPQFATVRYTVVPGLPSAMVKPGSHTMELAETAEGWRVWDADLNGTGYGRIRPPTGPEWWAM